MNTNFPFEVVVCFVKKDDCPTVQIATFGSLGLEQFLQGKQFKDWKETSVIKPELFHFITYPIRTLTMRSHETPEEVRWKSITIKGPSSQAVLLKPGMVTSSIFYC